MIVLGINYHGHDASATLIRDGELIAAIKKERFTRDRKYLGRFPFKGVDSCLRQAGVDFGAVDGAWHYNSKELLGLDTTYSNMISGSL